jgi:uncharacterized membrane protein YdjX (TVP38/TMEM64 family)
MEFIYILIGVVIGAVIAFWYFKKNAIKQVEKQVNYEAAVPSIETIKVIAAAFGAKTNDSKAQKLRNEFIRQQEKNK